MELKCTLFLKGCDMKIVKVAGVVFAAVLVITITGCVSQEQYNDMKAQNRIQQERMAEIEGQLQVTNLTLGQTRNQLEICTGDALIKDEQVAAFEEDREKKKTLIARMQQQLLHGGVTLPIELNMLLEDFAKGSDMVTFDQSRGVLKFKSDFLFALGSDNVTPEAAEAVKALCGIMNSEEGKSFNAIIAGHTDDVPIGKPSTRAKHPTNWHLSVHRSIAVLNIMTGNGVAPKRLSVKGFGQYRPVAPNVAKKGNPANRRVEIFIVPSGL